MGIIKNLIKSVSGDKTEFKKKFKDAEEEVKINRLIEERQKSSNRRELERYVKEQEEVGIKLELDKIHKKQNQDNWKSNSILKQKATMLKTDRSMLKEKNIFANNKNLFTKEHSIKHNTNMGHFK